MSGFAELMAAVAATIAARGREQEHLDAFGRVFRERAADTERLVVWRREDGHDSPGRHYTDLTATRRIIPLGAASIVVRSPSCSSVARACSGSSRSLE